MPYKNFDKVANVYELTRAVPKPLKIFFRNEILTKIFSSAKQSYKLLSLGIGTGRIEDVLTTPFTALFGIDISIEMLKVLKSKRISPPIFILQADCQTLPYRDHFDAIIIIHLTHLVEKWSKMIDDIYRLTNLLVISEVYTDIYSHPFYQIYISELKKCGWKKEDIGARVREFIQKVKEKYSNVKMITSFATMPTKITNGHVYDLIQNRYLSSFWSVNDEVHIKAFQRVTNYIKKEKIQLTDTFTTKSFCRIFFLQK